MLTKEKATWNCTPAASPAVVAIAITHNATEVELREGEREVCMHVCEREDISKGLRRLVVI